MSLKLEYHSSWNVIQLENHKICNDPPIGMSLKLECRLNFNITQIGMSLKLEYHSNENVTPIGM